MASWGKLIVGSKSECRSGEWLQDGVRRARSLTVKRTLKGTKNEQRVLDEREKANEEGEVEGWENQIAIY